LDSPTFFAEGSMGTFVEMPEGDTIRHAADRLGELLVGHVPDELVTHARFSRDRWPERLAGRAVTGVDAYGKHLFMNFAGNWTIHSHLGMVGRWRVRERGPAVPASAWLVIRRGEREAVQQRGPVLELMTEARRRFDRRLAQLGPDILAPEFDEAEFLRRLREDDPTRPIGDALLDQRTLAGIGNIWKAEGCFAAAVDPWRRAGDVSDEEARAIVRECRPRMQRSARTGIPERAVHGRAGRPCPRCGAPIRARGQGDANRTTFWCQACQR
jgi:endonuclease VIII